MSYIRADVDIGRAQCRALGYDAICSGRSEDLPRTKNEVHDVIGLWLGVAGARGILPLYRAEQNEMCFFANSKPFDWTILNANELLEKRV